MPSSPVAGSSPQRSNVPWSEPGQISPPASTSQGPRALHGLPSRSSRDLDAAARPRTPLPTPSATASISSDDGITSPGVRASPPRHEETPEAARQRLQAKVQTHAGEVERLIPFQQIVMDQTSRVEQRLNRARQKLATRYPEPEIQPADHAAAQASGSTGQQQAEEEEEDLPLLEWRYRNLGERQQQAAQVLQSAREDLAAAQEQLSALGPPPVLSPPSLTLTPPESPCVSMPGSPTSLAAPHTRSGSADSYATSTYQPMDPLQRRVARLQHQAGELGQTVQGLEDRLEAVRKEDLEVSTQLGAVKTQFKMSETGITEALRKRDFGAKAHLDKENGNLYRDMNKLEQRAKQLARSEDTLTALLGPAQRDLQKVEQQLAEANRQTSIGASPRAPVPTPSARSQASDMDTLQAALPDGGAAVARLAERAARRSPRTSSSWLRFPSFKGSPKPLEGKRQDAFMQLVRDDVAKVAERSGIPPEQAAARMFDAVDSEALGATLSQADKAHLLDTLDKVGKELATAQPQARQP